jgi:hypothetical protein
MNDDGNQDGLNHGYGNTAGTFQGFMLLEQ